MSDDSILFPVQNDAIYKAIQIIYYCQIFLGTSRITLSGRNIRTRSICWSIVWCLVSSFMIYQDIRHDIQRNNNSENVVNSVYCVRLSLIFATYIIPNLNIALTRDLSVKLYVICSQVQYVCENVLKSRRKIKTTIINFLGIIALGLFYAVSFGMITYETNKNMLTWLDTGLDYYNKILVPFIWDVDLLLWTYTCNLLKLNFEAVCIALSARYYNKKAEDTKTRLIFVNEINSDEEEEILENFVFVTERTIYAYNLLKQIHKYSIFFYCTKAFIWGLWRIYYFLIEADYQYLSKETFKVVVMINVKDVIIITFISFASELYCKELDDIKKLCLKLLDHHQDNSKVCETMKKILWLTTEMPPNLVFFGLFTLDGSFPFKFVAVFFTYTLVIIQFTFL